MSDDDDMTSGPRRIQRSRRPGWRKPEGAVVVSRPSKWGNPHDWRKLGRAEAVGRYEEDLIAGRLPYTMADVRRELGGKDLCCWCELGERCHADVLLLVANPII